MSEQFYILIILLSVVWSVLSFILFFKVWGMTNDVKEIKDILSRRISEGVNEDAKGEDCAVHQEEKHADMGNSDKGNTNLVLVFVCAFFSVLLVLYIVFSINSQSNI